MPIHWDGVLLHAMSGTELSRVRTELEAARRGPAAKKISPRGNCFFHRDPVICKLN